MMNETDLLQKVVTLSEPTTRDGSLMWELVNDSTLDQNSPYKYIMMCEFFTDTCVVAKEDADLVGFITGFIPPNRPDTVFIWQVGVHESQRGKGIASKMLNELLSRYACRNIKYVEATVTPSNTASQSLFLRLARDHGTECEVDDCFPEDVFPGGDHEAELMYRVGPLTK
ncbi:diaminobutyrate acetyltransferase [Evansella tamaricis]|uniref:L-2,4-diaminobutyric acid acetyltransferase n=1 Tax=Evansella tamaricis TaxID=2069301 RepID=A0ABS6JIJ7_9BACI|nr:diaminobutyrate acetyltransferase [Evansella tamaricis]MBU9713411.1 diaminobutyrate acetyltransferase [Evansella tamaricis]